jgi:hypothetical protein
MNNFIHMMSWFKKIIIRYGTPVSDPKPESGAGAKTLLPKVAVPASQHCSTCWTPSAVPLY